MNRHQTLSSPVSRSVASGFARRHMRPFPFCPLLSILLFVLPVGMLRGQTSAYPEISQTGKTMEEFIPEGWHFFDSTSGDLNKDRLVDLVLVVEKGVPEAETPEGSDGEESLGETSGSPRILVVLFRQKNGGYRRSVQANRLVLRNGEGGSLVDPWVSLAVDRGSLLVHFYGGGWWRWSLNYRFRFQDGDWFLIGATNLNYHSGTGEMESHDYNLLTGDVEILKGNMFGVECRPCEECETCEQCEECGECEQCVPVEDKTERKNIGRKPLRRLEDYVPWEWEILPEQHL